jgi:hypothetical protein
MKTAHRKDNTLISFGCVNKVCLANVSLTSFMPSLDVFFITATISLTLFGPAALRTASKNGQVVKL